VELGYLFTCSQGPTTCSRLPIMLTIYLHRVLLSLPRSSRFPHHNWVCISLLLRVTGLAHFICNLITWGCMVRSTNHEAFHAVFCNILLLPQSQAQISSSAPYFLTPPVCFLPLMWETKFYVYIYIYIYKWTKL